MPSNHAFVNENFLVLSVSFWKLHTITLFASKSPSYICLLLSNNIPEMSVSFSYASYICPLLLGSSSCKCPFLFLRHPRNVCFFLTGSQICPLLSDRIPNLSVSSILILPEMSVPFRLHIPKMSASS